MDPTQDAVQRGRTRAGNRRGLDKAARAVEEGDAVLSPPRPDPQRGRTRASNWPDAAGDRVEKGAAAERTVSAGKEPAAISAPYPPQDAVQRGRTRASNWPDAAGDRVEKGAAAERTVSAGKEPAVISAPDPPQDAVQRGRTRASNRPGLAHVVDEGMGDTSHDLDMVANVKRDKGASSSMVSAHKDHLPMPEAVKRPECSGGYKYNAELDQYTLVPVGTKQRRSYVLLGKLYRELLPHQREGVEWLWGVHCEYPGGIVADDMGLGKTFQAAVFLSGLLHSDLVRKVLIILPLSVLDQWPLELKNADILDDLVHTYHDHDCDDTVLRTVLKSKGIILTTYETYVSNYRKLMGSSTSCWDYVILDEAHRIKNIQSHRTGVVNKIHSKYKILLTGTPIQKDLMDLYSLLNFICPGLLGDAATFRKNYLLPVSHGMYANVSETEKADYKRAIEDVRVLTTTYILRRDKQVLIESGQLKSKKHDMIIWLRLTELQMQLYRKCEEIYSNKTGQKRESAIIKSTIWQAICNSPAALLNIQDDDSDEVIARKSLKNELLDSFDQVSFFDKVNSCKTSFIFDLVKDIIEEEKKEIEDANKNKQKDEEVKNNVRKILIFSRSLNMLDIIQECLSHLVEDGQIARIDGSVKKVRRTDIIQRFKSESGLKILLLSAKVGGEGLNLTAATRLILVDPSWNSSDDSQISDRIYRMGQQKDVYIYRLVTCRTVEEHTYNTQLLKGALGRGITDGMMCASSVDKKEGKVLCLPDQNIGFDSSETFHSLECRNANKLDFDGPHFEFLKSHQLVYGISNQNLVLSNDETPLSDVPRESSECAIKMKERPDNHQVISQMPSKPLGKDTVSKQQGFITTKKYNMNIPEKKVGLLIGRDGRTIEKIKQSCSVAIKVEKPRFDPSYPERSIQIMGTIKDIEKAKQMIVEVCSEAEKMLPKEEFLYVPYHMVGKVIGSEGNTVKEIKQKSGAFVQFVKPKRRFRLEGSQQQIDFAKGLICEIIDKSEDELSEVQEKYVTVQETMIGLVIGKQGRMLIELRQKSGASVEFIDEQKKFLLAGTKQAIESAEALICETIDKFNQSRRGSVQQSGGHKSTPTGGTIAGCNGYDGKEAPSNRSEYYGERGQSNEQRYSTPRPLRKR